MLAGGWVGGGGGTLKNHPHSYHHITHNAFSILDPVGVEGHSQEHPLLLWDWVRLVHLIGYLDLADNQSQASGATFPQFCYFVAASFLMY